MNFVTFGGETSLLETMKKAMYLLMPLPFEWCENWKSCNHKRNGNIFRHIYRGLIFFFLGYYLNNKCILFSLSGCLCSFFFLTLVNVAALLSVLSITIFCFTYKIIWGSCLLLAQPEESANNEEGQDNLTI